MKRFLTISIILTALASCSYRHQLQEVQDLKISAEAVALLDNKVAELGYEKFVDSDTVELTGLDGEELIIMNTEKEEETGEIVLTDRLEPAVIRAQIRNVPERNGKIDIAFEIIVPESLLNPKWQTRFFPHFYLLEDTLDLAPVYLTGKDYRESQLRGYELYERFLSKIIDPSNKDYFLHRHLLEIFIGRNIPELASLKKDSTLFDPDSISGKFGVSYAEAENYYRNRFRTGLNNRRIADKEDRFRKYVHAPFGEETLRLDSIIHEGQRVIYRYSQTLNTRPGLKKVEMVMNGDILVDGQTVYLIPPAGPLTYYVSSISGLMEYRIRYLTRIVSRNLDLATSANLDFSLGSSRIDEHLGHNTAELKRIEEYFSRLMELEDTVLDSVKISASCSPEGSWKYNTTLAKRRSLSARNYLRARIQRDKGESAVERTPFIYESRPEDWMLLETLLEKDTLIGAEIRESGILEKISTIEDPDRKEAELKRNRHYSYIRESIYPKLRTVDFTFYLHRKNMLKDTIHTTVPDTCYMNGLTALRNRDYRSALKYLHSYEDCNTAVALLCLDFTDHAIRILEKTESTARTDYLLAIAYSRKGLRRKALEKFIAAVRKDERMKHRGNLDPEISGLIDEYRLTLKKIENGTI